jgi:hypothetical protein
MNEIHINALYETKFMTYDVRMCPGEELDLKARVAKCSNWVQGKVLMVAISKCLLGWRDFVWFIYIVLQHFL